MYWENPSLLLFLWILPVVAWLLFRAHRQRIAAARTFVDPIMVERLMPSLGGPRPWIKGILLVAGLAALIVAAARPRFGVYTETVSARGLDLFVLLDVSRSMTAEDVAPSRMERAKSDVRDLLPHLAQDRVGLIAFAGKAVVKVPLTNDHGFFRQVLDETDVGSAPLGGTLIGDAIRKALENMPRSRDRDQVIVLLTDGDDQDSFAEEAAKAAAERGTKIFTVGLGDASEGARIPIRDASGKLNYVQYDGRVIWSKLNNSLLKKIALMTGGAHIPAGTTAYDLGQIYQDHLASLTRGDYQAEKRKRYREQFQWFVCIGLALLLIEMSVASYRTANRFSGVEVVPQAMVLSEPMQPDPRLTAHRHVPTALIVKALLFAATISTASWAPAASNDAPSDVRAGVASFKSGDFKRAAEAFAAAETAKPDDLRVAFDHGVALAAQDDDKAIELFQKAALSPDLDLAVKARYNLGCFAAAKARKRFGEHPEKASLDDRKEGVADLATAVGHFRDCLRLDKNYADARQNLELIRVWLKSMQSLWEQNDRQKQRDELDLSAYLQLLEAKQRELRILSRLLAQEEDSPKRHEAQRQLELAEQKLGEEIEPLKQKIAASAAKAGQAVPATPSDELKKAIKQLQSFADELGRTIAACATDLHSAKFDEAIKKQTNVVENFNQLYRMTAPFPALVGRAVATQDTLQGLNDKNLNDKTLNDKTLNEKTLSNTKPSPNGLANSGSASLPTFPDSKESGWEQDFVTHYGELLAPMAKEGLTQLEKTDSTPQPPTASSGPSGEEIVKQREGLKKSMEKAVELGPKIETLSQEAADLLREKKAPDAWPKQKECLKLLKEIADALPKQDQKQDDKKQNKDDPQKDKKDQDQKKDDKEKNKPDDKKQDDKKQDDKKKEQQKKDQQKKEQEDKEEQKRNEAKSRQEQAQDQALAAIRQVQERQQKRQEKEKEYQRMIVRPGAVDKDW